MATKVKIGIVGCGNILGQYVKGCRAFHILDLAAIADMDMDVAEARGEEFDVEAIPVQALLDDPEIQIVINLTPPSAHAEVNLAIIDAGKNVYTEKPLAITREGGKKTLDAAKAKGLLVGGAPDTFLGGGLQTCRKLIEDGEIGTPVAATAFMAGHGPESWHPNPSFFYKVGAGPMFDMGPYYLTAMVNLLGPAKRVTGSARISFAERIATSPARNGEVIEVEVPTHVAGVIDFAAGPVGTLITSFDVWGSNLPRIEIYGSEGSLSVPDPNTFGGPVKILRAGERVWHEVPLTHSAEVGRGIGPADMAYALTSGRRHRAHGDVTYHVLDLMHAFIEASELGRHIEIESTCEQPAPLPLGLAAGTLDE